MKISKLDKQQKLFDLYKQLGSMSMVVTVNGDIVLDDELKATIFAAIEPVLKRRITKGEVLPVFEGSDAMQIDVFDDLKNAQTVDAFPTEVEDTSSNDILDDGYAVGVGETPLEKPTKRKRVQYVDGFEKP